MDILRNEFNFEGIVMTDWLVGLGTVTKYPQPTTYGIIKATGDLYMPGSKSDYESVLESIKNGNLSIEELEISASRVYKLAKEIEN